MDDTKRGFFSFFKLFGLLFKRKNRDELPETRFGKYASSNIIVEAYEDVKKAAHLCDSGMKIAAERAVYLQRLQNLLFEQEELSAINSLSDEDVEKLRGLVDKLNHVRTEKSTIQHQIGGFDRGLDYMSRLEDQIPSVIDEMFEAEKEQRLIKTDMGYLSGEKLELEDEKEKLESNLVYLYHFSIILVCIFAAAAFVLGVMNIYFKIDVFLPSAVAIVIGIFFGSTIYILRRKLNFELKLNIMLQMRAVELLNKKTLHYAHYTNYLQFVYKKFRVKSADMLKDNWEEYGYYKHLSGRFKTVKSIVYNIEDDIQIFFSKRGLKSTINIDELGRRIANISSNKKMYDSLEREKEKIEQNLESLDITQENIWNQLREVQERDVTEEKTVSQMMSEYVEEIEKIFAPLQTETEGLPE